LYVSSITLENTNLGDVITVRATTASTITTKAIKHRIIGNTLTPDFFGFSTGAVGAGAVSTGFTGSVSTGVTGSTGLTCSTLFSFFISFFFTFF